MIKAEKIHKEKVIDILSECFETNKSVNWIVKQDSKKKERIKHLMDYSFEACINIGQIYLTENLTGVIICSDSHGKLPILEEAYLTAQFVLKVIGIDGIGKALRREEYIKQFHPKDEEFIYIWFIGLKKEEQGRGVGSAMLQEIIDRSNKEQIPIYLETSTHKNLSFYQKHGFEVYHISPEEIFGFNLYFLRRPPDNTSNNSQQ
jgi:ribosomal protein S18 acetylase RimI-like enzyme